MSVVVRLYLFVLAAVLAFIAYLFCSARDLQADPNLFVLNGLFEALPPSDHPDMKVPRTCSVEYCSYVANLAIVDPQVCLHMSWLIGCFIAAKSFCLVALVAGLGASSAYWLMNAWAPITTYTPNSYHKAGQQCRHI